MAETKVSMKLLIDTRSKRVLFAEAGKDCVDFLFYILSLPVSTITHLLGSKGMVGSLGNLYESVETLDNCYIQPNSSKNTLLKPVLAPASGYSVPLLSLKGSPMMTVKVKRFYKCANGYCSGDYVSDSPGTYCPSCKCTMTREMPYAAPPTPVLQESSGGGFVKGVVTYMVMDDLVVKPLSTISSITLLNKFNIKDVGALEEKEVTLGMNEAVKLLKASLESKMVLTNVFLNEMK